MALMTICKCGVKIPYGTKHCGKCAEKVKLDKSDRNRHYDITVRQSKEGLKYYKFYRSAEWLNMRELILSRYYGLCLGCWYKGLNNSSEILIIHHIIGLKENWDLRLKPDNLIPLCRHCHEGEKHDDVKYWEMIKIMFEECYNK